MIVCKLKQLMKEQRVTQEQLRAATGLSRVTISQLCSNSGEGVRFRTLELLCEYFHCGVDALLVNEK